ncbi:energy-coupling factor ABC transporter ATP-binding protein [Paenibacillus pasadenensis]|uniref:ABC transporter ATP-binding protein n=1 Tax=Paenibacillus pasadenensis TaxID=217090 RepID=UPI00203B0C06|nr:ABC transporter ATP-binding protein [Paenibacillus pasadenensis]MCM3749418.1 energy-coupling factor ABC transporter ATP-binding protein [Paenibacillus pasadenensis]
MTAAASPVAVMAERLRLKYPGEQSPLLFQGLNVTIRHGEKVLLLGPSGCGKSTLLQVLGGLAPAAIPIPLKADRLIVPERAGYVFQDPDAQFCMPYADEELAFALENRGVPQERMPAFIARCLEEAGLKLDDPHTPIATLSQGMKQRLAVASMLAVEPDTLLLDEPTALLDEEGTAQVWDALRRIWEGRTVIIVEHKIGLIADDMDRILLFAPDGSFEADAPPDVIFRDCRSQLQQYGIWYPGFWEDYAADRLEGHLPKLVAPGTAKTICSAGAELELAAGSAGIAGSTDMEQTQPTAPSAAAQQAQPQSADSGSAQLAAAAPAPLLELDGFAGLRGRAAKVRTGKLFVYPGDWIAVTGANGAGKSTLLLAIMRLVRSEGRLCLCGVPEQRLRKAKQAAEHAAYCFQNPEFQLVTDSVRDELDYSLPDTLQGEIRDAHVRQLMSRFRLNGLGSRHPYQLSMGQKRRLSVASAMARGQRLLLLDEPTFGLDAAGTAAMMEHLEELRRDGCAIVMITHDGELVRRFTTRHWLVEDGQVHAVPFTAATPSAASTTASLSFKGGLPE